VAFNEITERVLHKARANLHASDRPPVRNGSSTAIRYAVLKIAEEEWGLPVMVKYGDADAVLHDHYPDDDLLFEEVPVSSHETLFSVEPRGDIEAEDRLLLMELFAAIGAWYLGTSTPRYHKTPHHIYLWPESHPIAGMVEQDR
jgi:hypothetical protein